LRGTVFPVIAETEDELEFARAAVRQRIAFYASTRTYKAVLDVHGWGDLTDRLHAMAARGDWAAMGNEITDEMLEAFCVTCTPDDLGAALRARFDGLVDRLLLNLTYEPTAKKLHWRRLVQELAASG
jgi:alkanesulfonate monooxygenase SsuD/methylene tetrahydromethanopterin reductase-like flavin-dependent oxidoreductase (luciferase family)